MTSLPFLVCIPKYYLFNYILWKEKWVWEECLPTCSSKSSFVFIIQSLYIFKIPSGMRQGTLAPWETIQLSCLTGCHHCRQKMTIKSCWKSSAAKLSDELQQVDGEKTNKRLKHFETTLKDSSARPVKLIYCLSKNKGHEIQFGTLIMSA